VTPNTTASNIAEVDTNLTYVTGTNSTGPGSVSLWTENSTSLELATYAPGTKNCWYIIDLKAPSTTVWGMSLDATTYYSVNHVADATGCTADGTYPTGASTPQTRGFPHA
jgi:hypothetical protein